MEAFANDTTHYCYDRDRFLYKSSLKYLLCGKAFDFNLLSLYLQILAKDVSTAHHKGFIDETEFPRVFAMPWIPEEFSCDNKISVDDPKFEYGGQWVSEFYEYVELSLFFSANLNVMFTHPIGVCTSHSQRYHLVAFPDKIRK